MLMQEKALYRQLGKEAIYTLSVEHKHGQARQLDEEIELLREKLHRLVNANPARLRSGEAYQLSTKLDQLITKLQSATNVHL